MTHPKALKHWVRERVEIPVHYDAWMRGARTGLVTSVAPSGEHVHVKMDHPQVRHTVKVAVADLPFMKVLRLTRK